MNLPYSFDPLLDLLEKLNMTPDDLVKGKHLSRSTVEKIINHQQVMLATVAKLCISLGCEFSDVVAINYAYDPTVKTTENAMRNYEAWTQEEEEYLVEAFFSGAELDSIAEKLKRSRGAIQSRINWLSLSGRLVISDRTKHSAGLNTPSLPQDAGNLHSAPDPDRVRRIEHYERLYDEALASRDGEALRALNEYLSSGLWLEDYEADERGELPPDLKRGVLSQDALYDLLTEEK